MLKGIDISRYQADINLASIETDFVIIKATEGVGYTDPACNNLYQQAHSLNKKIGVYHFARPDLNNNAIDEADYFLQETKGYQKEAILILDWESQGEQIKNTTWAKNWLDRVYEKTGVRPLIYMSASVMIEYDWSIVANENYGLWVANYGLNNGHPNENVFDRYPLKYWSFCTLWQYTSVGRLNGYNDNLDMDYFYGDANAWDKYAGINTDIPSQKTIDQLAKEVLDGLWGNGEERKNKLTEAGYNYQQVQNKVNDLLDINQNTARYYTVRKGDNLTKISKAYNTTINQLILWNNIQNADLIYAGQKLRVK